MLIICMTHHKCIRYRRLWSALFIGFLDSGGMDAMNFNDKLRIQGSTTTPHSNLNSNLCRVNENMVKDRTKEDSVT